MSGRLLITCSDAPSFAFTKDTTPQGGAPLWAELAMGCHDPYLVNKGMHAGEGTKEASNSMMPLGVDLLEECVACKSMYYGCKWITSDR